MNLKSDKRQNVQGELDFSSPPAGVSRPAESPSQPEELHNLGLLTDPDMVGIELGRADGEVEGYHPRPFGCEVGSHFHQRCVSRGPPTIPEGRISRFRFSPWLSPRGLPAMAEA